MNLDWVPIVKMNLHPLFLCSLLEDAHLLPIQLPQHDIYIIIEEESTLMDHLPN